MIVRMAPESERTHRVITATTAALFLLLIAAVPSHPSAWNASATPGWTPQCAVSQEDSSAWNFTVSKERDHEVAWYDVSIFLIDREGTMTPQRWAWEPEPLNLTGPGPYRQSIKSIGGVPDLFCTVTDITGNNRIDSGDYFVIESDSGDFDRTAVDELTLVYEPTANPMWTGEFHEGELVRPSEFPWTLLGLAGLACIALVIVLIVARNRKSS